MKKLLFITLLCIASPALAQTAPAPVAVAKNAQVKEQKFEAHKAEVLQRMGSKISEMQQKQQCVQSATSGEAMKACMPKGDHKGGKTGCGLGKL